MSRPLYFESHIEPAYFASALALAAAVLFALSAHIQNMSPKTTSTEAGTLVIVSTQAAIYAVIALFFVKASYWFTTAALLFAATGLIRPALSIALWIEGIKRLGPTLNSALTSSSPFFAAVAGILILGEQLTPWIAVGIVLVIAGAVAPALRKSGMAYAFPVWALLIPLCATALRNIAHAITKLGFAEVPSPIFAALVATCVSLVLIGGRFLITNQPIEGNLRDYRFFVASGITAALAVYLVNLALLRGQVITVAPLVATSPIFSALLGYYVFGRETLTWRTFLAIALVVPGVILIVLSSA